jgi:hypothetical protein
MEKNKTVLRLSLLEKTAILELSLAYLIRKKETERETFQRKGICDIMEDFISQYHECLLIAVPFIIPSILSTIFPLFTYENAKLRFNAKPFSYIDDCPVGYFWWAIDAGGYDFDNRIAFLNWMIECLRSGKEGTCD